MMAHMSPCVGIEYRFENKYRKTFPCTFPYSFDILLTSPSGGMRTLPLGDFRANVRTCGSNTPQDWDLP